MEYLLGRITDNLKELKHLKKMSEDIDELRRQNECLSQSAARLKQEHDLQLLQIQREMAQLRQEQDRLICKIRKLEEEKKDLSRQIHRNEDRNARNHEKYTDAIASVRKQCEKMKPYVDEYINAQEYAYNRSLPPELYRQEIIDWYRRKTGKKLNLNNPRTINDKINWMKLYDATPIKTRLADKYRVREWVAEKIGEHYLVPLIGVWKDFDEIDFSVFPEQFVLKCTHGSGMNVKVDRREDFDQSLARRKFQGWMKTNYAYTSGLEMHYKDIEPRIIAEKYLAADEDLKDFKFYCFHGKAEYIWVTYHDDSGKRYADFFDTNWNLMPFTSKYENAKEELRCKKPELLSEMITAAERLSDGFSFVRVDLYAVENRIYFGEMTFTSGNGTSRYLPEESGLLLGQMI